MNELVVIDAEGSVRRFPLTFDTLTIGRDPRSQIVLDDPRVSRRHARVFRGEKGHYIEDLGSANGVLLDGVLIRSPALLLVGAKIEVGGFVLTVAPEGAPQGAIDGASPRLKGITGSHSGQQYILSGPRVTIGRIEGNQVVIEDPSVSRHHARIQRDGDRYLLSDLGSSNGTFVGGRPITQYELQGGEKITFGSVSFRFLTGRKKNKRGPRLPPPVVYAVAAGLVLIATGIALALILPPPPAKPAATPAAAAGSERETAEALSLARAALQREDWDGAEKQFDRVLARDLTHVEAKAGKAVAHENGVQRSLLQAAEAALGRGEKQEALKLLGRVPPGSVYSERAQRLVARISDAERDAKGRRGELRLSGEEERALKARYNNAKVEGALALYIKGDFDGAIVALQKIKVGGGKKGDKKAEPDVEALVKEIRAVRQKQADGQMAARVSDNDNFVDKAVKEWSEALQHDKALMPDGVRSLPQRDIKRMIGNTYYRAGYYKYYRGDYPGAFAEWKKGTEWSVDNLDIYQGFIRLENQAQGLFNEAEAQLDKDKTRACAALKDVLAITLDTARVNAQARAILQEKCR